MSNASGIPIDEDIQKLGYEQHVVSGTPGPSVADEEETVSILWQCIKDGEASVRNDVPTKDGPENFGGKIVDMLSNEF